MNEYLKWCILVDFCNPLYIITLSCADADIVPEGSDGVAAG